MRILHIVNKLSDRGNGIVNVAVDLALDQQRLGHTVAFMAGHGGNVALVKGAGITVFQVEQDRTAGNLLLALIRFGRVIRRFRPDVIHAHMQTGLLLAIPWARLLRIPIVGQLHNIHDSNPHRMGWADGLIAVSDSVRQDLLRAGVPAEKMRVVLNGTVRSPRLPPIERLQPAQLERPSIVSVAGMSYRKGVGELIEAFTEMYSEFPEAHLYLAGEGPERGVFEEQAARSAACANIHFIGFQEQPQRLMLAADVFVLASRRDSFGLVLAEAREAGCAIVASDVDGIPEALDGGRAGILVPPQSPAQLAEALRTLLRNPELRRSWGERARDGVERFTVSRMSAEVLGFYRELLAGRSR